MRGNAEATMKQARLKAAVVIILLGTQLTGCGNAAKVPARDDMDDTKAQYKLCLDQYLGRLGGPDQDVECRLIDQSRDKPQ